MNKSSSEALFRASQERIPGGVNSPVRAFRSVGGTPLFFEKGSGCHFWDVDGNRFVDFVCSWGAAILGHAHPEVVEVVQRAATRGLSFGAPTEAELQLAELICRLVPSIEQVRLVSSGTEATMSAIRLARGATGRDRIIKFEGCYHGHADMLLVKAGSGALTFGHPSSGGVPEGAARQTTVLPFNDAVALCAAFDTSPGEFAAVIIEPIAGNMNFVRPDQAYMDLLRELCTKDGCLLILDEVMTGFRVALGGAQSLFGITPDLTTLGKIAGGGMPLAAFGGRRDIMRHLAPLGPVYQAGTLSGNPVSVAAGLKTLEVVSRSGFYDRLDHITTRWTTGLRKAAVKAGVDLCTASAGGMFGFYFSNELPSTYEMVMRADRERFNRFFHAMLDRKVYLAPSAFEAGFVSSAHGEADVDEALSAANEVFSVMSR